MTWVDLAHKYIYMARERWPGRYTFVQLCERLLMVLLDIWSHNYTLQRTLPLKCMKECKWGKLHRREKEKRKSNLQGGEKIKKGNKGCNLTYPAPKNGKKSKRFCCICGRVKSVYYLFKEGKNQREREKERLQATNERKCKTFVSRVKWDKLISSPTVMRSCAPFLHTYLHVLPRSYTLNPKFYLLNWVFLGFFYIFFLPRKLRNKMMQLRNSNSKGKVEMKW